MDANVATKQELHHYAKEGRLYCWDLMEDAYLLSQHIFKRADALETFDESDTRVQQLRAVATQVLETSFELMGSHYLSPEAEEFLSPTQ